MQVCGKSNSYVLGSEIIGNVLQSRELLSGLVTDQTHSTRDPYVFVLIYSSEGLDLGTSVHLPCSQGHAVLQISPFLHFATRIISSGLKRHPKSPSLGTEEKLPCLS